MKKVKYYYNTQSLRYEKIEKNVWKVVLKYFGFLCGAIVFAGISVFFAFKFIDSPKEKELKREISHLQFNYELIQKKMDQMNEVLYGLQERDDNLYRVIFEADPIPSTIRTAGIGGSNKYKHLENSSLSDLLINSNKKIDQLGRQLYIQSKSYDEIQSLLKSKEDMLASIPAIQPISNKELSRFASGFGFRIDPIYKTRKMHAGVDFSAPTGSDVYVSGNGVIEEVKDLARGYGKHVVVNHGYGYKTLYAHLSAIKVKRGQKVKRGEVIGLVGNTGKSTAPHLHYEVFKNGQRIDPINYFFNDLSPEEYETMIDLASRNSQSFD